MFGLLDPEVWNVIFAIAGGLLGWWLKHQGGAMKPAPADPSERLRQLLEEVLAALKQQKEQKNG